MPRNYSTKKLTDLPLTSGYFNQDPHGPTKGYVEDPAVKFVLQERIRYNSDIRDKELFERLEKESQQCQESGVTNTRTGQN